MPIDVMSTVTPDDKVAFVREFLAFRNRKGLENPLSEDLAAWGAHLAHEELELEVQELVEAGQELLKYVFESAPYVVANPPDGMAEPVARLRDLVNRVRA